ncbi:MAG TPA: 2Fe-2S iron-sulfur cluster-binding protein [Burkholderiaceae bacterium]|nr:2Fe-2S iron-sulfur cluster-binding protein [Burkholderiaceae bacterium]
MPMHKITIQDDGSTYPCADTRSLLEGMEALGRKGIPVGCRGGGCGVCKVQVVEGTFVTRPMSRDHVSVEDEAAGRILACRARPTSDITLRVIGAFRKAVVRPARDDESSIAVDRS